MVEEIGLTVAEAAERLQLTPRRVTQLVASGDLTARRIGRALMIDRESIERRADLGGLRGRRFSAARAWGLLFLIDGLDAPWLDPVSRAKVRKFITEHDLGSLRPRLVTRAARHQFRAHPSDLARLQQEPRLMRTGTSAARDVGLDLVPGDEFDAYLTRDRLEELVDRYRLRESRQPNLSFRVTPTLAPDWPTRDVAPPSAVALDLSEDREPRAQETARRLLERYQP